MSEVSRALAKRVAKRARNRCEYCQLSQEGQEAAFHIDHVQPRSADGPTTFANLALACVSCSLRKWARQTALDPESAEDVPLFNPRKQNWNDHFAWSDFTVMAKTPTGRATVAALQMNRALIVAIRQEESERGRHPPE